MHLQLCLNLTKLDSLKTTPIYILLCPELQLNLRPASQYCLVRLRRVGQQSTVGVMNGGFSVFHNLVWLLDGCLRYEWGGGGPPRASK